MIVVILFWNAYNKFPVHLLQILFLSAFLFVVLILAQSADKCNTQNAHSFGKIFVHMIQDWLFRSKQVSSNQKHLDKQRIKLYYIHEQICTLCK